MLLVDQVRRLDPTRQARRQLLAQAKQPVVPSFGEFADRQVRKVRVLLGDQRLHQIRVDSWHCHRTSVDDGAMDLVPRNAAVHAVSLDDRHRFSKAAVDRIVLLAGLGVQGDAHAGVTVQHRSRVAADPTQPNLRQVHLLHSELFDELRDEGYQVRPGQLGENITTRGIDLLGLPRDAVLHLGDEATVQITGLRNPCAQINTFRPGLLKSVLVHDDDCGIVRKAGVMGIVLRGGAVSAGDSIRVVLPSGAHVPLEKV